MATKIRLARGGAKKRPHYRVVVANATAPRDGDFLEKVGTYDPMLVRGDANRVVLKSDRIEYWLSTGAQPTDRVARFIEEAGILLPASIKKKMEVKIKNRKIKPPKKESKKSLRWMPPCEGGCHSSCGRNLKHPNRCHVRVGGNP